MLIELELEENSTVDMFIGSLDRIVARQADPLLKAIATGISGAFERMFASDREARARARDPRARRTPPSPSGSRPPPRSEPRARPAPAPSMLHRAREVLGFEVNEPLTKEMVQKRRQALARVFHPDTGAGSEEQMKRVNLAADLLLSKLP